MFLGSGKAGKAAEESTDETAKAGKETKESAGETAADELFTEGSDKAGITAEEM